VERSVCVRMLCRPRVRQRPDPESRPNARGEVSAGPAEHLRRNGSDVVLRHIPEWRVLAYRRGKGMVARIFAGGLAEDGVILLLPLVRVRFAVSPAEWIQWSFVVAPRMAKATDRCVVFEIDQEGRPVRRD
jgi:hypothetical protein